MIAIAKAAATEPMRMSRCFTCDISCASTPLSSSGGSVSQDALGHADHGMAGVATGGERVGLLLGRDVDAGHRDLGPLGEVADDRVQERGSRPG